MNSMSFDSKEDKKFFDSLLHFLIDMNMNSTEYYNEIHIYQEERLIIVEWEQVPFSGEWGGKFKFVEEDQTVMKSYELPNGEWIMFETEDEYKEYLEDWLKDNPGWVKTSYGRWTNQIENEKLSKDLLLPPPPWNHEVEPFSVKDPNDDETEEEGD